MEDEEIIEDDEITDKDSEEDEGFDLETILEIDSFQPKKKIQKREQVDVESENEFGFNSNSSPVLNQVEQTPENFSLEMGVANSPVSSTSSSTSNGDDPFKYSIGNPQEDEKKYLAGSQISAKIDRFDPTKIGTGVSEPRTLRMMHSLEQDNEMQKYEVTRKDPTELGREDPFQPKEISTKKMDYEPLH